jgi:hypothetical protein
MDKTLPSAVALTILLGGCQTWGPTWSEVTGARYATGEIHMYRRPAIIENVDAQGAFVTMPIKIDPGKHRLVLSAPTPGWPGGSNLQVMMLDALPCKRYYINAQFRNDVERDWTPVLDYVEDIAGCKVA